MESKMKKRGMEDLIDVKLQLLHGVSYLILFYNLLQSSKNVVQK